MARIKGAVNAHKKRRKIMKLAKGYYGAKSKQYRAAKEQVMRSLRYAYIGRKLRKRDFRQLWIARINAAARITGLADHAHLTIADFLVHHQICCHVVCDTPPKSLCTGCKKERDKQPALCISKRTPCAAATRLRRARSGRLLLRTELLYNDCPNLSSVLRRFFRHFQQF